MKKLILPFFVSFLLYSCDRVNQESTDAKIVTESNINDSAINTKDVQLIIDPVWWSGDIYQTHDIYLKSLKSFSENQKYIYAIQWYQSEVNNGGHEQFFYNSTGIVWEDALNGFKKIGLNHYYDILQEAVRKMGGNPPFDRDERMLRLESVKPDFELLDNRFYELDKTEPLQLKLFQFIDSNRTDFYFKGKILRPANAY